MNSDGLKILQHPNGGYVECDGLRFEFQPAGKEAFAIYFPRRKHDRRLRRIRAQLDQLVELEPMKWEVLEHDSPHGFYRGMSPRQRLEAAGLAEEFEAVLRRGDWGIAQEILTDLELSAGEVRRAIEDAQRSEGTGL